MISVGSIWYRGFKFMIYDPATLGGHLRCYMAFLKGVASNQFFVKMNYES